MAHSVNKLLFAHVVICIFKNLYSCNMLLKDVCCVFIAYLYLLDCRLSLSCHQMFVINFSL